MSKTNREANHAAWMERVAEFKRSGLSVPKWCAAQGVKDHQLRYWLKKLAAPAPAQTTVQWLPLEYYEPEPALIVKMGPAVIEVRDGFDPQLLIAVVKTLSAL